VILSILAAGVIHQASPQEICEEFGKKLDRVQIGTVKVGVVKTEPDQADRIAYEGTHASLRLSKRTGEPWVFTDFSFPRTEGATPSIDSVRPFVASVLSELRPKIASQFSVDAKKSTDTGGYLSLWLNRSISGVPVYGRVGTIGVDSCGKRIRGFHILPSEEGIYPIKKWSSEKAVTQWVTNNVFGYVKGVSQMHYRGTEKTYAGADYFRGPRDEKHLSAVDPTYRYFLFPCYRVTFEAEHPFIWNQTKPFHYLIVFIDANTGKLMGHELWSGGGVPMDATWKYRFENVSIRTGTSVTKRNLNFSLFEMNSPAPSDAKESYVSVDNRIIKVLWDKASKTVYVGVNSYKCEGWPW
jgi:hypothetical protein